MRDDDDDDETPKGPSVISGALGFLLARPVISGVIFALLGFVVLTLTLPKPEMHDAAMVPVAVTAAVQEKAATEPLPEKNVDEMQANPPVDAKHAHVDTATPVAEEPETVSVPVVADLALLVTDVGLSRRVAEAIGKELPRETNLAISAYATDPAATAKTFSQGGYDVWLHVATQSVKAGFDPGPLALSSALTVKQNVDFLRTQIESMGGVATGIYVPNDADITAQSTVWKDIALEALALNMLILDGTTAKVATELYMQKAEAKISAYLKTDIHIDGNTSPEALQKALDAAVPSILKMQEAIVVVTHPTVLTVESVGKWAKTLAGHGIQLVPASKFTGLKP